MFKKMFPKCVIVLICAVSFFSATHSSYAEAGKSAPASVEAFMEGIRSMKFPVEDAARHEALVAQTGAYLDLRAIGEKSLTEHWGTMSAAQQQSFLDLFSKLIASIAYPRTNSFLGTQKVVYSEARPIARGVEVASTVKDSEADLDVPVTYDLYEDNGQWKIYDIFMDGVSMTEDLKTQFNKMIQDGSVDNLLSKMSERLVKAQKAITEK